MKVTVNGLKQYVDFDWSLKELIENLTMLGLEVEGVEKIGGGLRRDRGCRGHRIQATPGCRQTFGLSGS